MFRKILASLSATAAAAFIVLTGAAQPNLASSLPTSYSASIHDIGGFESNGSTYNGRGINGKGFNGKGFNGKGFNGSLTAGHLDGAAGTGQGFEIVRIEFAAK